MKANSILLITFCLLQVLNCAKVKISEQSLKKALIKALKSQRSSQESIKLSSYSDYTDLIFTYSPLTSDNIKLYYDDFLEELNIRFDNLKTTLTGKHIKIICGYTFTTEFIAQLANFKWEQVFNVSKKNLGNRKFTPITESRFDVDVDRFTQKTENIPDQYKNIIYTNPNFREVLFKLNIRSFNYTAVKNQLTKISQLILQYLQSDLK